MADERFHPATAPYLVGQGDETKWYLSSRAHGKQLLVLVEKQMLPLTLITPFPPFHNLVRFGEEVHSVDTLYIDESQFDFEDLADLEELLGRKDLSSLGELADLEDWVGLRVPEILGRLSPSSDDRSPADSSPC